ncbi:MAG: hypothetical protein LBR10_09515 [Prevotellaceae bacterium]|jgi:hypothetical protein|nr:hypothetical protein [Prevotellaceae bacterium]
MENIFDIIEPIDKTKFEDKSKEMKYKFINKIDFTERRLPNTEIAVLSVGNILSVRKVLYEMYFSNNVSIADLGNIPISKTDNLTEILKHLSDNNIFTIIIGNSADASAHCFDALIGTDKNVENKLSASIISPSVTKSGFLDWLISNRLEYLFNLNIMAYQTYLSDPEMLEYLSSNYFETLRLGKFRENNQIYEPLLRDTDMLSIDITAVKKSEIPDCRHAGINGLYAEEICLIAKYAGMSDNLKIISIFGLEKIKENGQTSELIAQIIWHIAEGFANRAHENMLNNVNGIKKIFVNLESPSEQLIFYHSDITNRWWMEVQGKTDRKALIIACSEEDYKIACRHDIPLKWIWYQQKTLNKN